ncbi:MAG: type II toxin-antitoxin system RatA family toxin [Bdellovibrionales bacterium]|jgi:coenzyme Q-binding protein COQ10
MPQHSETRVLPYAIEQMFDLVADVERYPEFLPWCKEVRIIGRGKDGLVADMVVGTKLFSDKFTSQVVLDRPTAITVNYRSGPLSHLSTKWAFKAIDPKTCEVFFDVDFDFRSPLLHAAMTVFFDKALKKMVEAFEGRAKELYGDVG